MKRTKIASVILAIVMLVSMLSVSMSASAVDADNGQTYLKNVTLSGSTISGSYTVFGWLDSIEARVGQGTNGQVVGTYKSASWSNGGDFSINLSDGGKSTSGYSVTVKDTGGSQVVTAYIPYSGPVYKMEIQKNGSAVTSYDLGVNEGTVSGFSFVYENGGSYTVKTSGDAATMSRSGDTFSITPKKVGTFEITATCNGVSSTTLTVNVTDDSTLRAQWYDTGAAINNNATFNGQATVVYGFGVEAYPDNYTVSLSNNTANATYSKSSVQGQYPNSIVAATKGSVRVTIANGTKTIAFTVNFADAPEPVFGFYTDSACKNEAEPLVQIKAGTSATIYTNEAVATWKLEGTGATKSANTSKSITIAASTVDSIVTVRALASDGSELGWFDVYVTGTTGGVTTEGDVFVFKLDDKNAYYYNQDMKLPIDGPATYVNGKTYVPFRAVAAAAGITDVKFNNGIITFTGAEGINVKMTMDSTTCVVSLGNQNMNMTIAAPTYVGGVAMLPVRDTASLTGASIVFDNSGYVVVSPEAINESKVPTYIAAFKAK